MTSGQKQEREKVASAHVAQPAQRLPKRQAREEAACSKASDAARESALSYTAMIRFYGKPG
jgi:hypothetical protein